MSIWAEIKKALNTSLGEKNFVPLNEKLLEIPTQSVLSYTEDEESLYLHLGKIQSGVTEETRIGNTIVMKNAGSFALRIPSNPSLIKLYVYINGEKKHEFSGKLIYRVDFSAGDEIYFTYTSTVNGEANIFANVGYPSLWEIIDI